MFFSGEKEYWKWLETNNQTQENIIDKRFNLKEIVSLTRESAQNSVDAFFSSTEDQDTNNAVINYKFNSSNADLSKYFSGLISLSETKTSMLLAPILLDVNFPSNIYLLGFAL